MKPAFEPHKISSFRTLHDWIVVSDMRFAERLTSHGIILPDDNGKGSGIRPRWARVYAVGPKQTSVQAGQWICVAHGRWTRGVKIQDNNGEYVLRKVDPKDILLISDEAPQDDTMSDAVHIDQKSL